MVKRRTPATPNEVHKQHEASKCFLCRNKRAFELPDHLLDDLQNGRVVVFAGAGVSTETQNLFPTTLYQEVYLALGLSEEIQPSFPSLMSMLCERPNGRRDLLHRIHKRFSYVTAFRDLYRAATRFHRELATLFYVQDIVTTNWDNYFELECGAIPLVTPEDFAFWDLPKRKVFKIHGSISNLGSIVATEQDYAEARVRLERGALGSALKLLLATKTIVYIGYSFTDHDFTSIQNYIQNELKNVAPKAYIITLDHTFDKQFKQAGLHPIYTDATFFVAFIKKHLEVNSHYLADEWFEAIPAALDRVNREHERLFKTYKLSDKPEIAYCASYQDGLAHAFERICDMKRTGEYSHRCEVVQTIQKYEQIRSDNIKARSYFDVAYIDGYVNALLYLLLDNAERRTMPFFYVYGLTDQPTSFTRFKRELKQSSSVHKAAYARARKMIPRLIGPHDVIQHTPFLTWNVDD